MDGTKISNAIVNVIDNIGNVYVFKESEVGAYTNIDSNFIGIVGRSYKCHIITPDGNSYESDFKKLLPANSLDNVYFRYEPKLAEDIMGDLH